VARSRWPWIGSVALTAGLLAYLLSGVQWQTVRQVATHLAPAPLAWFGVLLVGSVAARAVRFWILLGRRVPILLVGGITLVRNLFVDLLPARLGELSFVYLLVKKAGCPMEDGLAALVLGFLLDLIALAPLLGLAVLAVGPAGEWPIGWLVASSAVLAAAAYGALRLAAPVAVAVAGLIERHAGGRLGVVAEKLRLLALSLVRAQTEGVLLPGLAVSMVLRLCKYGSIYCLILSIMTPLGYTREGLEFFKVFLAAASAEMAAALPVHGLAGFGTYETAWTISLVQLGIPREHAVVSGILGHAIGQIVEYTLGGASLLWLTGRPRTTLRRPGRARSACYIL
jgi:uncharacterized membrane protein YbhN (UPF0104 family)